VRQHNKWARAKEGDVRLGNIDKGGDEVMGTNEANSMEFINGFDNY
jgi:hypothetical protein